MGRVYKTSVFYALQNKKKERKRKRKEIKKKMIK